jgi:hypothetical protein
VEPRRDAEVERDGTGLARGHGNLLREKIFNRGTVEDRTIVRVSERRLALYRNREAEQAQARRSR